MARARNLKPSFFTDAELIECEHWVRLLFAGLWTLADRDGRLLDRPKQIGVDLFPRENLDIDAGLNDLAERGFITRYDAGDQHVIQVKNFGKHQNPHKDERGSTLPPLHSNEEHRGNTGETSGTPGANPAISPSLSPDPPSPDSQTQTDAPAALKSARYSAVFEEFWREWNRDGTVTKGHGSKVESYAAWKSLGLDARNGDGARQLVYDGLATWRACGRWRRGYVKDCQRWLGKRMFGDEPPVDAEDMAGPARASPRPNRGSDVDYLAAVARGEA